MMKDQTLLLLQLLIQIPRFISFYAQTVDERPDTNTQAFPVNPAVYNTPIKNSLPFEGDVFPN